MERHGLNDRGQEKSQKVTFFGKRGREGGDDKIRESPF